MADNAFLRLLSKRIELLCVSLPEWVASAVLIESHSYKAYDLKYLSLRWNNMHCVDFKHGRILTKKTARGCFFISKITFPGNCIPLQAGYFSPRTRYNKYILPRPIF